jgi:hypothetical protein
MHRHDIPPAVEAAKCDTSVNTNYCYIFITKSTGKRRSTTTSLTSPRNFLSLARSLPLSLPLSDRNTALDDSSSRPT